MFTSQIKIKADPTRGGDLGNYWHYILGFFLPLVIYLEKNKEKYLKKKILVDSCHPLMDLHTIEYLNYSGFCFEIKDFTDKSLKKKNSVGKTLRRKIWNLLQVVEWKLFGEDARIFIYHDYKSRFHVVKMPRWDEYLQQYEIIPPTLAVNMSFLQSKLSQFANNSIKGNAHDFLLLKRSNPPKVLSTECGKRSRFFEKYGTERRHLQGINELAFQLKEKSVDVVLYEPGTESLQKQIYNFSRCKGIIGVRGAEFINMFWMKPQSIVIMYESLGFTTPAIQPVLAKCLGLRIFILDHQNLNSPNAELDPVFSIISTAYEY
jgi:hypothetical protein